MRPEGDVRRNSEVQHEPIVDRFLWSPFETFLLAERVNECPFFKAEMTANYREILPHWSVAEKLLNECFSIRPGFCKEQNPGRVTVDAMYDKGSLPLRFQLGRKKRLGGWGIGVIRGHGEQLGWFIQGDDGIVFIELDQLP